MILKSVILKFLNQRRDNLRLFKKKKPNELDTLKSKLPIVPPIWRKLYHHQRVGFILGVKYRSIALWFDMGCVDAETEYLSPDGWKRISDYDGSLVAQYHLSGRADFVKPTAFIKRPCSWMYRFKTTRGIDQKLSPEHRVLYSSYNGSLNVTDAKTIASEQERLQQGWRGRFLTTFKTQLKGIDLSDDELRLMIAVIADGHFPNQTNRCVITLKKQRKKRRLRSILNGLGIEYVDKDLPYEGKEGYTLFSFLAPRREKEFGKYYWECSQHQLQIITDECWRWDGSKAIGNRGPIFCSCIKASADFVQYAFAATGLTAFVSQQISNKRTPHLWVVTTRSKAALIGINGNRDDGSKTTPVTIEPTTDGFKYCFEVPTSFLVMRRNGNIFITGNTGKTLLCIALIRYFLKAKEVRHALVLVPNNINMYEWQREIKKHSPNLTCTILDGTTEEKWDLLQSDTLGAVVVATYAGLMHMVCVIEEKQKKNRITREITVSNKMRIVPRLMRGVVKKIDALVMDESTVLGNPKKLPFRICRQITNKVQISYALAGRPFGREVTPLWAQMFLIDRGASIGKNLAMFRAAYFKEVPNEFSGFPDYVLDRNKKGLLYQHLSHRSIRYPASSTDLPKVVPIVKEVQLPVDAEAYYQKAKETLNKGRGNLRENKNLFMRLRQISSGWLGYADEDSGKRAQIEFPNNPKLQLLLSLIETSHEYHKIVVMHDFIFSGSMIERELDRLGIGQVRIYSKTPKSQAPMILERFDQDPKCRVFIINAAGAYGLNLQKAQYQYFYESPPSVILREQMERRVERQGSEHDKIFRYDLLVEGTVDQQIREFHQEGRDLFEEVMQGKAKIK